MMEIRNLQRKEKVDRRLIERAARAALEVAGLPEKEISLALVGERVMKRLNFRYKGRKGLTDVLSFPLQEDDYLGEVVISPAACRLQSRGEGGGFERELALLVIHGVLHLAGHDHTVGAKAARKMKSLEKKALENLENSW